jgi:hypothetical protein
MKFALSLILIMLSLSLFALRDFEQVWVFDEPDPTSFIVNSDQPVQYHYHAMINGTPYIQNQSAEEWLFGWQKGSLELPGYVGFSKLFPQPLVSPVFAAVQPQIFATTQLETDPLNDHLYNNTMLDIFDYRMVYTADRLYFAIKTANPSYATSSGFTYFAYMPVIVDPISDPEDDPIVYGLMYTVDMAPVVSPGLYKITGSGFNGLNRLGDIEHSIEDGYLVLSCNIADLTADPDFSSWYDPDYPLFVTTATTSRITLVNGIQQADMTDGLKVLIKPHYVEGQNLSSPVLDNPGFVLTGPYLTASIDYYDADANVPHLATISIDGAEPHPLSPMSIGNLDYHSPVTYAALDIPLDPDWQSLTYTFSDGADFVEYVYDNPASSTSDEVQNPVPQLTVYPNPAGQTLYLKSDRVLNNPIFIYNLKGQRVGEIDLSGKAAELDLTGFTPGIYILKAEGMNSRKFLKM